MSDVAIRVEGLGKRYRIGPRERYYALRDVLARSAARLLRRGDGRPDPESRWIWALEDVSFEVKEGEVVGIIGRNGAGKTTLLKILARITKPTEGYAEVRGRVGSLLEVGTGFHPELTGRENVYLSGAVLGMRRREIERKFDEIVDFAGVDRFIDTPLKYYSAGMQTRLAFAVAAHLDPEILLVDEVLAVGDLEFQRKCLGKMQEVSGQGGRTVVFVSHQMNQIRRLCQRVMWLDEGRLLEVGDAPLVISAYESALSSLPTDSGRPAKRPKAGGVRARFVGWEIAKPRDEVRNVLKTRGPVTVRFFLDVHERIWLGHHGIALFDNQGTLMWAAATDGLEMDHGRHELAYLLESLPLRPGTYWWQVSLYDQFGLVDIWDCVPPLVIGTEPLTHPQDRWTGVLNVAYRLTVQPW